jgi:hypothetical protein
VRFFAACETCENSTKLCETNDLITAKLKQYMTGIMPFMLFNEKKGKSGKFLGK